MSMIGFGLNSSMVGMTRYAHQAAVAAGQIARAGLEPEAPAEAAAQATPAEAGGGAPPVDLAGSMVSLMLAHRLFTASLRAAQTADRMLGELANLPSRSDVGR